MTEFAFNRSDLHPGSPRVPPHPLVAGAIYVSGTVKENAAAREFLGEIGVPYTGPRSRWLVVLWDSTRADDDVAKASFMWSGTEVILEGLYIKDRYQPLGLDTYLIEIGSALFGNRAVVTPDGQRRDVHDEDG